MATVVELGQPLQRDALRRISHDWFPTLIFSLEGLWLLTHCVPHDTAGQVGSAPGLSEDLDIWWHVRVAHHSNTQRTQWSLPTRDGQLYV
jgi:hypothetical protein